MPKRKWYVYENLNNPQDRKVLSDAEVVAGIYTVVAGPFDEREAAEAIRKKLSEQ